MFFRYIKVYFAWIMIYNLTHLAYLITFIKTQPIRLLYPTNVYSPTATYKEKTNIEAKYISIKLWYWYIYFNTYWLRK